MNLLPTIRKTITKALPGIQSSMRQPFYHHTLYYHFGGRMAAFLFLNPASGIQLFTHEGTKAKGYLAVCKFLREKSFACHYLQLTVREIPTQL
jgi:hypothetical protein